MERPGFEPPLCAMSTNRSLYAIYSQMPMDRYAILHRSTKPGAICCGMGHTHIYFPRDFKFHPSAVPVAEKTMEGNRAAYAAVNPFARRA